MALADDTRGKREYDKFVEDVSGNTGMRVYKGLGKIVG